MNGKLKNILLVEDTADDHELIQLSLEESGLSFNLIWVKDGQQAVDYLTQINIEYPDVILLDLKLPILSGFEVLKAIRGNLKTTSTPVVIFTSSNLQSDIETGYNLGANSMVTKPVDAEKFMECVRLVATYWLHWNVPPPH